MLSDVFENKNKDIIDQQKKIAIFADKYSYQNLIQKFRKPKSFRINALIDVLKKKMEKSIIDNDQTRKLIWMLASGALFSMNNNKGLFNILIQYPNYPDYYEKAINADVKRTITKILTKQDDLKNLLIAFSRRNPYIGYCQGLNFIGNFLLAMQFSVEEAFWILSEVMETVIPMDYFTNMVGVVCDQEIFLQILGILKPKIMKKFNQFGLDGSILSIQWFVCLFTSLIPIDLSKIVWDRLLVEGTQALIKAGLIILSYFQKQILESKQFYEIILLVENGTKNLEITQQQFNKQFNKYYINQQGLKIARDLYRELYFKKKIQEKILENLNYQENNQQSMQCDINWPICLHTLSQNRKNMKDIEIWTYRQHTPPLIYPNYINDSETRQKNKNYKNTVKIASTKSLQISEQVIGRMQHTCKQSQKSIKKIIDKIQRNKTMRLSPRKPKEQKQQKEEEEKFRKKSNFRYLARFSQIVKTQSQKQFAVKRSDTVLFIHQFCKNNKEIAAILDENQS